MKKKIRPCEKKLSARNVYISARYFKTGYSHVNNGQSSNLNNFRFIVLCYDSLDSVFLKLPTHKIDRK